MSQSAPLGEPLERALADHPLRTIAVKLADHLRVGCDVLSMVSFLSLAGSALHQPFNLIIASENPGADCLLADRLARVSSSAGAPGEVG